MATGERGLGSKMDKTYDELDQKSDREKEIDQQYLLTGQMMVPFIETENSGRELSLGGNWSSVQSMPSMRCF